MASPASSTLISAASAASDATEGISTPRLLLRQSLDRAGSLNFPFHTPFDTGSVTDEHVSLQPQDTEQAAGSLDEPLLDQQSVASTRHEGDEPCSRSGELWRLLSLALPLCIQSWAYMIMVIVSTTFVGHLNDPTLLSAVVLASSLYNVLGSSLIIGLVSGMETLCGQAFGARNYPMLGIVLQRAQLICCLLIAPIGLLFYFIEPVLLALGQHPEIVAISAEYLRILTPGLFLLVVNETTRKYLLAQRVVNPAMVTAMCATALSPVYNYLYIYRFGWGARGAALAVVSCSATSAILISCYRLYRDLVLLRGTPQQTWHGWSRQAFAGWGLYLSYGVPAAAMICLEWWVWEIMIFSAGLLPTASTAVGVMGLGMQISGVSYMIPGSLGSATSTRVANSLGAGLGRTAGMIAKMSLSVIFLTMLVLSSGTYLLRREVVRVFTDDESVVEQTAAVVPAVAASLIGDGVVAVASGVLRACGRQTMGVTLNLAGYWCIGLPLAYLLGFKLHQGVLGFWIALASSAGLQAIVFVTAVLWFDWQQEVRRAKVLTAKHASTPDLVGIAEKAAADEEQHQPLLSAV